MFRSHVASSHRAGGRYAARRLAAILALSAGFTSQAGQAAGPSPVSVYEHRGTYTVMATFAVPEAPAIVLATLTDYDQIPRFLPDVRTSTVLARNEHLTVVEQEAVARFMMFSRRIHLLLQIQQEAGILRFSDRCGKSFTRYEGAWTMTEKDGQTEVGYRLVARPAFDVPQFVLKRLLRRDSTEMIDRLKAEIASRAQ